MTSRFDVVARAPGRVNLMGDHTDYTGGFCLPIAIDRRVEVAVRAVPDSSFVTLRSVAEGTTVQIPIDVAEPAAVEPAWGRFVAAVLKGLGIEQGYVGEVRSNLPMRAGLSSSAALEVATALAFGGDRFEPMVVAELCRDAEHEARGVPTGLLDQLAVIFGVAGHALLVDCSTNTFTPTPLPPAEEVEFVVIGSGPRSLAASGYAERVDECHRAEAEIGPLRLAGPVDVAGLGNPTVRRRARHVVSENGRVLAFAAALTAGELADAGRIMDASHRSLSEDFESSTPAVDSICEDLRAVPGVLGARITGGGWGGSVVAMTRPGALGGCRGHTVHAVEGAAVERG